MSIVDLCILQFVLCFVIRVIWLKNDCSVRDTLDGGLCPMSEGGRGVSVSGLIHFFSFRTGSVDVHALKWKPDETELFSPTAYFASVCITVHVYRVMCCLFSLSRYFSLSLSLQPIPVFMSHCRPTENWLLVLVAKQNNITYIPRETCKVSR